MLQKLSLFWSMGISLMSGFALVFKYTATFLCVSVSRSRTAGADTLGHDGHIVYINMTYDDNAQLSLWWWKQWHFLKHWHIAHYWQGWLTQINCTGWPWKLKILHNGLHLNIWTVMKSDLHFMSLILVRYQWFNTCKGLKYHINQSWQWHNPLR